MSTLRKFVLKAKIPTTIHLIDGKKAIEEFSSVDQFIQSMSPFDFECRMNHTPTPTVEEYISFITKQILHWSDSCAKQVESVIDDLNENSSMILKYCTFPSIIYIILTNGNDEANAAYCRNNNLIVLPLATDTTSHDGMIRKEEELGSLTSGHEWNSTIKHELFHIWSRNNIQMRDMMYEILGYNRLSEPVHVPHVMANLKITNPDACVTEHYITLKTCDNVSVCVAPVLIASGPYIVSPNPNFFEYVKKLFIVLDKNLESTDKLISYDDVIGLRDKIGNNTDYIIHPEEVLADNFVLLLNHRTDLADQWILNKMNNVFEKMHLLRDNLDNFN